MRSSRLVVIGSLSFAIGCSSLPSDGLALGQSESALNAKPEKCIKNKPKKDKAKKDKAKKDKAKKDKELPDCADLDDDGVANELDLCPGTPEDAAVDASGCAASQRDGSADSDADGVLDLPDLCPNTPSGDAVDANGCSIAQVAPPSDSDGDGVPDQTDVCPASPSGTVDATGCSPPQRTAFLASARSPAALTPGAQQNGFQTFVVEPNRPDPIVFRVPAQNVTPIANGYRTTGTLLLDSGLADEFSPQLLLEGEAIFEYGPNRADGVQTLRANGRFALPQIGYLGGLTVAPNVKASLGLDLGQNLGSLEAPLVADRKYIFVEFATPLTATLGDKTFEVPVPGPALRAALDPSDPFFYLQGANLGGLSRIGRLRNVGLGVSVRGLIPFRPMDTLWGLDQGAIAPFSGHLYVSGKIDLGIAGPNVPFSVQGRTVINLAADGGGNAFVNAGAGVQLGVTGTLKTKLTMVPLIPIPIEIAQGTIGIKLTDSEQTAYFSGTIEPNSPLLPADIPFVPEAALHAAGIVSNVHDMKLAAEGRLAFDGPSLGGAGDVVLQRVPFVDAKLLADKTGLRITGSSKVPVDTYYGVGQNTMAASAFFDGEPANWFVVFNGDTTVYDIPLTSTSVRIDASGVKIDGQYRGFLHVNHLLLSGRITSTGASLSGSQAIIVPVHGTEQVLQWITDGATCGYDYVKDGAICGFDQVTDGAVCGYHFAADGSVCGYQTVTSAGVCGVDQVTDGATCGYAVVTDAAVCGWGGAVNAAACGACQTNNLICGDSWYQPDCYACTACNAVANTCQDLSRPRTCDVAKTCTDYSNPSSCNIANTCGVARSCEDLSKPKTCESYATVPTLGEIKGIVNVTLTSSPGLSASLSGMYCPPSGACVGVGGRVELSATPKACFNVPVVGEVCQDL